jgi:putative transposase
MSTQRKQYSAEFKARVALEALKGLKTVNELASTYGVPPTQITIHWEHRLQKEIPEIFSARRAKREHDAEAFQAQLYQQIGKLKVERDWLKKKLDWPPERTRDLSSQRRYHSHVGQCRGSRQHGLCGGAQSPGHSG